MINTLAPYNSKVRQPAFGLYPRVSHEVVEHIVASAMRSRDDILLVNGQVVPAQGPKGWVKQVAENLEGSRRECLQLVLERLKQTAEQSRDLGEKWYARRVAKALDERLNPSNALRDGVKIWFMLPKHLMELAESSFEFQWDLFKTFFDVKS